ncbi:MFS transporter [Amycolatopsis sp. NPDC047767]|uniref:MFS transporter n=1 Tax=Amycolatopsis sp. NPDC047767 TaxID=3156765 RepID=UPI0034546775
MPAGPPEHSGHIPVDQAAQARVVRKAAFRIIPIVGIAYFLCNLERSNLSVAALSMNRSLGLTETAFGIASGVFFIGYFLAEVPSNLALVRFGARRWLARITITWGILAALTAAAQGPTSLYVWRALLGFAEAGLAPGVIYYFTLWFPSRDRGKMVTLFTGLGGLLGSLIGNPLSGGILTFLPHGAFGLEDWRVLFVVEGALSVILGFVLLKALSDRPEQARWLTAEEQTTLKTMIEAEASTTEKHPKPWRMLLDVRLSLLSVVWFFKSAGAYALTFFLPTIVAEIVKSTGGGHSSLYVASVAAIPSAIALIGAVCWSWHSDRTGERRWHSAVPLFVGAAGLLAYVVVSHNLVLVIVALTVATIGLNSISGAFFQIPSLYLSGAAAATGLAMVNATGNLGGFVGPYLFGAFSDATGSFAVGTVVLSAMLVAGGVIVLMPIVVRSRRSRREPLPQLNK